MRRRGFEAFLIAVGIVGGTLLLIVGVAFLCDYLTQPNLEDHKRRCLKLQELGIYEETRWDEDFGCLQRMKNGRDSYYSWMSVSPYMLDGKK